MAVVGVTAEEPLTVFHGDDCGVADDGFSRGVDVEAGVTIWLRTRVWPLPIDGAPGLDRGVLDGCLKEADRPGRGSGGGGILVFLVGEIGGAFLEASARFRGEVEDVAVAVVMVGVVTAVVEVVGFLDEAVFNGLGLTKLWR